MSKSSCMDEFYEINLKWFQNHNTLSGRFVILKVRRLWELSGLLYRRLVGEPVLHHVLPHAL